ncbi:MAG: hypothetical protein WD851_01700 [Pirellulales bacterium]
MDEVVGIQYLADAIPMGTGWQLEIPFAAINAGEIVGYGLRDGELRGFLLTPVPELGSLPLIVTAILLTMTWLRTRSALRV